YGPPQGTCTFFPFDNHAILTTIGMSDPAEQAETLQSLFVQDAAAVAAFGVWPDVLTDPPTMQKLRDLGTALGGGAAHPNRQGAALYRLSLLGIGGPNIVVPWPGSVGQTFEDRFGAFDVSPFGLRPQGAAFPSATNNENVADTGNWEVYMIKRTTPFARRA